MSTRRTEIGGLKELERELMRLPDVLAKKTIYGALRGGGNVVKKQAQSNADASFVKGYSSGNLKRSLSVSRDRKVNGKTGRTSRFGIIVHVRRLTAKQVAAYKAKTGKGSRSNKTDPFYWWWLEFGTSKMPATGFLRRAFESTTGKSLSEIKLRMSRGLAQAAADIEGRVNRASGK